MTTTMNSPQERAAAAVHIDQAPHRRTTPAMTLTEPVVSYRFPCTMDSTPSITHNPILGELQASNATTATDALTCPFVEFADGVQSSQLLESEGSVADLQEAFDNAEALVVETWITPFFSEELAASAVPMISMAQPDVSTKQLAGECDGIQFSLDQVGNELQVRYKDFYDYLPSLDDDWDGDTYACRVLPVTEVKLKYQDLNHIIVMWKESASLIQIYINGEEALVIDLGIGSGDDPSSPTFGYDLQSWDPTYTMQLFANQMTSDLRYGGLIHKVSLFNNSITPEEIHNMYEEGLEERKQEFIFDPKDPLQVIASALPAKNVTVTQGSAVSIPLGGDYNISSPFWDLMVEILSLPTHGKLMELNTDIVRKVGDRISVDGGLTRANVMYWQAEEDYFTNPKHSFNGTEFHHGNESFSYRLIAANRDNPEQLFGWSETVEQGVTVVHANHEPNLEAPSQVSLPAVQNAKDYERPFATLDEVVLQNDLDYNIDKVRVDLWVLNGTLSIVSEEAREMADFTSCIQRSSSFLSTEYPWQCHGDGLKDRNMTFIATPDEVTEILSSIQYDAFYWEQEDTITLRIFDGKGGSCLSDEDHLKGRAFPNEYKTVHDGCFQIVKNIHIPPMSQPTNPNSLGGLRGYLYEVFIDLKDFSTADLIGWGALLLLLFFVCCVFKCLFECCFGCLRRRREAVIHIEDYPASRMTVIHDIEGDKDVKECDAV